MTVTRTGKASTLDIVNGVQGEAKEDPRKSLPPERNVTTLADQSIFVRSSIQGVEPRSPDRRRTDRA